MLYLVSYNRGKSQYKSYFDTLITSLCIQLNNPYHYYMCRLHSVSSPKQRLSTNPATQSRLFSGISLLSYNRIQWYFSLWTTGRIKCGFFYHHIMLLQNRLQVVRPEATKHLYSAATRPTYLE